MGAGDKPGNYRVSQKGFMFILKRGNVFNVHNDSDISATKPIRCFPTYDQAAQWIDRQEGPTEEEDRLVDRWQDRQERTNFGLNWN